MPKRGAKKQQPAVSNSVEELMRMLVEERAQRESAFAQREREVQTQMTTMQQHMELGLGGIAILVLDISYRKIPRYYYLSRFLLNLCIDCSIRVFRSLVLQVPDFCLQECS